MSSGLTLIDLAKGPGLPEDDIVLKRLRGHGFGSVASVEKRTMFRQAAERLLEEGLPATSTPRCFWVPGRIEIVGKHTDYAGGRSLLAATTKGFAVVSVDRDDELCQIFTVFGQSRSKEVACLKMHPDLEPSTGDWSAYPATTIRRLVRNFGISKGADIAVECDLPESSGMSSSSAVICYMWMVLSERNDLPSTKLYQQELPTPEDLYAYLGFIENGQSCGSILVGDKGVGTFGGSEDHTAIMSSEPGKVKLFSYCPTKQEGTFDFPSSATFVVAVSGAIAEKTGAAMADYNNAAFLARDAALAWCKASGTMPEKLFVEGRPNLAEVVRQVRKELHADATDETVKSTVAGMIAKVDDGTTIGPSEGVFYPAKLLEERFCQFFDESEVINPAVAAALASEDWQGLGKWTDESHRQTVVHLRNTVPETAWLPDEARRLKALAASAFGAGFGGSCWAIVEKERAEIFRSEWESAYLKEFPHCKGRALFFVMDPAPGAFSFQS